MVTQPCQLKLRCYAKPENNYFVGICIDLDIAVRGDSISKVKEEMTKAIKAYFLSLDENNVNDVFPRPAPLSVKLEYFKILTLCHCLTFMRSCREVFSENLIPRDFSVAAS